MTSEIDEENTFWYFHHRVIHLSFSAHNNDECEGVGAEVSGWGVARVRQGREVVTHVYRTTRENHFESYDVPCDPSPTDFRSVDLFTNQRSEVAQRENSLAHRRRSRYGSIPTLPPVTVHSHIRGVRTPVICMSMGVWELRAVSYFGMLYSLC